MSSTVHLSPLAYLAALIRVLIAVSLACIVYVAVLEYRRTQSTELFRETLRTKDISQASSYLVLAHQEPIAGWLLNFSTSRANAVALLYSLFQLLHEKHAERALAAAENIPWDELGIHERGLMSSIQLALNALQENIDRRNDLERRLQQHGAIKKRLRGQFALLSSEFGQLVGLQARAYQEERGANFYLSGILKGLPRLEGLPDGVQDQDQFKAILKQLGGKVWQSGNSGTAAFREKIASIRSAAEKVEEEEEAMYTEEESANGTLASIGTQIEQGTDSLEQEVALLLSRTEPISLRALISANLLK